LGKRHQSEKSTPDKDDASKFWIGENGAQADNGVGTDFHAIANNYVLEHHIITEHQSGFQPKDSTVNQLV
jgi:broad specificity polyphosphatase/5'/3'-nucleotidase SurE